MIEKGLERLNNRKAKLLRDREAISTGRIVFRNNRLLNNKNYNPLFAEEYRFSLISYIDKKVVEIDEEIAKSEAPQLGMGS